MNRTSITVQSPGRINIIGEHIDYNDGFVLPAAINMVATFQLSKNGTSSTAKIHATNVKESVTFNLDDFKPMPGGWQNYVMGVVHELQQLGANIGGFEGDFDGNVPIGGGMSSSAALECSLAFGLNELFDLGLDKWQLIKASQMAEHNFVGIKCGIMDQFASMMGKANQAMLLDCRSLDFDYFPLELGDYQLLLLNTNVSHNLATSEYNARRSECEQGLSILKKQYENVHSFRDVDLAMLKALEQSMPEKVYRRCKHVLTETQRVLDATKAMQAQDFVELGQLIYASHDSLSNDFEVSCVELDFLVQQTFNKDYILGSRMMGGGFGGCTLNLIEKSQVAKFTEEIAAAYEAKFGVALSIYEVSIGDGAKIVA